MQWIDLKPVLHPVPYAVVGGVATRLYMPERMTKDLDIVIAIENTHEAHAKLKQARFVYQGRLELVRGSTWLAPNGQEVDVLEGEAHWWQHALHEAQTNVDGQGLPVLPLHYLVLMKYTAGRAQDLADIERMLGQATDEQLSMVRELFYQHAPDEIEDLESLIALGKLGS